MVKAKAKKTKYVAVVVIETTKTLTEGQAKHYILNHLRGLDGAVAPVRVRSVDFD